MDCGVDCRADSAGRGYSVMPLVIMCVAGVIIGLLLLVWEYFDRWDYRRLGQ